jgi:hypothetical protein
MVSPVPLVTDQSVSAQLCYTLQWILHFSVRKWTELYLTWQTKLQNCLPPPPHICTSTSFILMLTDSSLYKTLITATVLTSRRISQAAPLWQRWRNDVISPPPLTPGRGKTVGNSQLYSSVGWTDLDRGFVKLKLLLKLTLPYGCQRDIIT